MKTKIIILSIALGAWLAAAAPAHILAQSNNTSANNPPANSVASQYPCSSTDKIGSCIVNIYRWALGAAVLLALLMIIFGGYKYITSQGNAQDVSSAKEMFVGAIIGLIILFAAVVILRTINPDLVNFNDNIITSPGANNSRP